jgi:hypothetical protein
MKKRAASSALLSVIFLTITPPAFAERVEVKGVGTLTYDAKMPKSKEPTEAERQLGLAEAKKSAWKAFVAKQNPALQQMIFRNERHFSENLDRYIIDAIVLDASMDKILKTLTVVARIAFNDVAVAQMLQQSSIREQRNGSEQTERSDNSTFAFLLMARKQISVKQFDGRRTDVRRQTTARTTAADGAVTSESVVQTGGNTLRKEDEITYAVTSSQDLDAAMNEALNASGIEPVAYEDIVGTCSGPTPKSFQNEYVSADEMSPKTRAAVFAAARKCEVRYFAAGTVDVGAPAKDSVSGMTQVFVSVRAQLLDLSPKLPRRVGSVGPKTFSGLGPDNTVAAKNALTAATQETVKILVDQLNAKGIR